MWLPPGPLAHWKEMVVGEMQEPGIGGDGFPVEPGEGDAAPGPLNTPALTGEGGEGEGAGEGEGSKEKDGAWSKDKAAITRLQQSNAELTAKVAEAEKIAAVEVARSELVRRQGQGSSRAAPAAAAPLSEDERAAEAAVDAIFRRKTGMGMEEAVASIGHNAQGVGNAAVSGELLTMQTNPDAYPHYAEVAPQLKAYAAERGGTLTPEGIRFAYEELARPLRTIATRTRNVASAKAKATERAAINNAVLPGGGGGANGGDTVLTLDDIRDESKVTMEDLQALIEDADVTDHDDGRF